MYTMKDLERITDYSRDQLRDRLGHLGPIVADDQRRGPRNALLVGDSTLALLRRMQELEAGELGPQDAATVIAGELNGNGKHRLEKARTVAYGQPEAPPAVPRWVEELLAAKDQTIAVLREENERLTAQVDRLLPLALPAPRRWWPFGRKRDGG